ncbi:hypothetical protein [Rhodococcus erythropolis]|uniref:hypothetical protein n=1 Tax=Rhodococcus erythropolis TaxID=1833 RepID=UPI0014131D59|nr:hypothetical protein [Rhodococcus erythropolis]
MKRDRTGELVDDSPGPFHDPRCQSGWLGEDAEGHPRPCLKCRPHLAKPSKVLDTGALYR